MPSDSVDSIVTDPPYELGFMGKKWDSSGIAYDQTLWAECLRVLKPGGHLIAFGGTRTYHRMTCAIEDAGFEIRDCIQWIYGSGFPKSLDVSKAIDKQNKDNQQKRANSQLERRLRFTAWVRSTGLTSSQIDKATGTNMGGHYTTQASQPAIMTRQHLDAVRHLIGDVPDWVEAEVDIRTLGIEESEAWKAREVVGEKTAGMGSGKTFGMLQSEGDNQDAEKVIPITAPHLPTAQQWHGFGTALKPANEPAVLARKPLSGTVADNVLTWGVGGLNIDGCRVEGSDSDINARKQKTIKDKLADKQIYNDGWYGSGAGWSASTGRWPANVILDEEAAQMLDAQSGHDASRFFYVAKASRAEREAGLDGMKVQIAQSTGMSGDSMPLRQNGTERKTPMRANHHPTVKPITLMRYLVRLVTPPGGTVLDPFMGSGSTGCAAMLEAMQFIGIELSAEYLEIARRRIEFHEYTVREKNPMGL
jgi:DNA modification methylase